MNEEELELIDAVVERLDNLISMLENPHLPDAIHVEALRDGLPSVREQLHKAAYDEDEDYRKYEALRNDPEY